MATLQTGSYAFFHAVPFDEVALNLHAGRESDYSIKNPIFSKYSQHYTIFMKYPYV